MGWDKHEKDGGWSTRETIAEEIVWSFPYVPVMGVQFEPNILLFRLLTEKIQKLWDHS